MVRTLFVGISRRWRKVLLGGLLALQLVTSSCATLVSGPLQKITLNSGPSAATVTVHPGQCCTSTPASVLLRRDGGPYTITFKLEGYDPYEVQLKPSTNGWLWANLLIGNVLGLLIDIHTGAAWQLSPGQVNAALGRIGGVD